MVTFKGMWYDYQEILAYYKSVYNRLDIFVLDVYFSVQKRDEVASRLFYLLEDTRDYINRLKPVLVKQGINRDARFNFYCISVLYDIRKRILLILKLINKDNSFFVFFKKYDKIVVSVYDEYCLEFVNAFVDYSSRNARLFKVNQVKVFLNEHKDLFINAVDLSEDEITTNHEKFLTIQGLLDEIK